MKILVVDDKASVRKTLIKILTSLGLEDVVEAEDGSDAGFKLKAEIKGVKKDDFDLIVSDMEMPGMWGLDLLRHVRGAASVGGREPEKGIRCFNRIKIDFPDLFLFNRGFFTVVLHLHP